MLRLGKGGLGPLVSYFVQHSLGYAMLRAVCGNSFIAFWVAYCFVFLFVFAFQVECTSVKQFELDLPDFMICFLQKLQKKHR